MNTNNFITARTLRRRIITSLQEQQRQDSACSEQLRVAISRHTRVILTIVSDLLMSYTKDTLADPDGALFFRLMPPRLTPELWLQSRAQEAEALLDLTRAKERVKEAESEYDKVAPFGKFVTGLFSNEQEKAQINGAKVTRARLRRECQQAESGHEAKLATVHSNAEHFLRNAMTPEGIAALLEKSPTQTKLQNALESMSRELSKLWLDHTVTQSKSIEGVRLATSELFAMYRAEQTTTRTPLLGAANAATRN